MRFLPAVGIALAFAALTACQGVPRSSPAIPDANLSPGIRLDAAALSTVAAVDTTGWTSAERRTSDQLVSAIGAWTRARLAAAGSSGTAKVIVQNARISEKADGPQITVDGVIDVRVEAADRRTSQTVYADAVVRRQAALPATASAEERDRVRAGMARGMIDEIDPKLEGEVRRRMGSVILP